MTDEQFYERKLGIPTDVSSLILEAERDVSERFADIDARAERNQYRVLQAFRGAEVAERHFYASTGYGYGDEGRQKLSEVFADVFETEAAVVSPHFMSGTHTIAACLFGLLRPGDRVVCVTGEPYDTLRSVISGSSGSLQDFGVTFDVVPLREGAVDMDAAIDVLSRRPAPAMVYLQRSTGYDQRAALTTDQIGRAIEALKKVSPASVFFVDNCYGEFVCETEPTSVGADIVAGSLIKNPGGGLAPTGGYAAGKRTLIDRIGARYSAPGVGLEIGSYPAGYQYFFQGLFMAPHAVGEALKGVVLASSVFQKMGFETIPGPVDERGDITQVVQLGSPERLVAFVRGIQEASAVDAHVVPFAWDMPGYADKVIMAAGTFVQGASLELTADAPLRAPYSAYLQGGLTYAHAKLGVMLAAKSLMS